MKTEKLLDCKWSLAKQGIMRQGRHLLLAAGVLLAGGSVLTSCTDKYDLDERDPEGWGGSIYNWLDGQGNYTNTVRLIDELGYHDVLAKTGSKTLFVADDAAYERFFANNSWGVRKYEELTEAQKKLLLYGSMISNSIQLNNLSSVEGNPPRTGECMRRLAASSEYDSVPVLTPEKMPKSIYWQRHITAGKPIVCMNDGSIVPVVQFIEAQLKNNRITNEDYDFLYNNKTKRKDGDASINGVQVDEPNIRCSNGFIHKMAEVMTPLPNMAELIAQKSVASEYNTLLERFCAPYPDLRQTLTREYNRLYNTNVDTVYQKHFFSSKTQDFRDSKKPYLLGDFTSLSNGNRVLEATPDLKPVPAKLKFDPEWNSYYAGSVDASNSGNVAMQRDMGVMMVPSNEALDRYWNQESGRVLKDNFGSWEKVPDDVLVELINTNMLISFNSSVPSKFDGILNDANDPMGVKKDDIDSVWLACNGAVYLTNRVYSPTRYVSVSFPALINKTMKVIDWAIKQNQYHVYLNSLGTYYSFFIPTNGALLEYIDPTSYGKSTLQLLRFYYDETLPENSRVYAQRYDYDPITGQRDSIGKEENTYRLTKILKDILDTHIVIGNVEDGKEYYRTKNGTEIRVKNVAAGENGMTVEGSYQVNELNGNSPIPVSYIYNQTPDSLGGPGGNGKTYILEGQPIMGTSRTVYDILKEHAEFEEFYKLMNGGGIFETIRRSGSTQVPDKSCGGTNVSLFNTYHYTVYVPSNEDIKGLIAAGKLSTWETVEALRDAGQTAAASADSAKIVNFVRYHIQDNSLFIGANSESGDYETSLVNAKTKRYCRLKVRLTDTGIDIQDAEDQKNKTYHHVLTDNPALYNLQAREYQYDGDDATTAFDLYTSSSAVVHRIDRPLIPEE